MSAMPGLGLALQTSTNAHADDAGTTTLNTPVNVVAGNGGTNIAQILEGLSGLNSVENAPALSTIAQSAGGGLGGIPPWLLIGGGLLLILLLHRK